MQILSENVKLQSMPLSTRPDKVLRKTFSKKNIRKTKRRPSTRAESKHWKTSRKIRAITILLLPNMDSCNTSKKEISNRAHAHMWEKIKRSGKIYWGEKNNMPWGSSSNCFSPPSDPWLIPCFLGFAHKQVTFEIILPGPYSSWACATPRNQSLFWISGAWPHHPIQSFF